MNPPVVEDAFLGDGDPTASPGEVYNVYTGRRVVLGVDDAVPTAAQLGLEPPRFCSRCGRRMIVQISPDGWWAKCSRHGVFDSIDCGRR